MRSLLVLSLVVLAGSCGDSGTPTDIGGVDGGTDAPASDVNTTPRQSDPLQVKCGTETCVVPGEVCCYGSVVGGGQDRCEPSNATCSAPNRACDETADCPSGQICCSGAAVLPRGSTLGGFAGTTCVDKTAPHNCLPEPGVGKSSVQVCKKDDECTKGPCILEDCYGYPLATCGGSVDCK